jgi:hypothetical protein
VTGRHIVIRLRGVLIPGKAMAGLHVDQEPVPVIAAPHTRVVF